MKNWTGIYGQVSVIEILNRLIESSYIPHALLFTGLSGVGKEFMALRFAQALNSLNQPVENQEKITNFINNFTEPYIKYILPLPRGKNENDSSAPFEKLSAEENELYWEELTKKIKNPYYKIEMQRANTIKISSIRDIKKFIAMNYSDIAYRIILISDAHLMNEEAQNALLKNLEEPPEGIIFILCTPFPNLLRDTIRSRCWQISFQPLANIDIKQILVEYFSIDDLIAEEVAPFAAGSVITALKLLDQDFELLRDRTIYILRYSFGRKYHSALSEFNNILADNSAETLKLLVQMLVKWLIDVQKFRHGFDNYYFSKHIETLEKFNKRFPEVELQSTIFNLDRMASSIQNNINQNLILLNTIMELSALTTPELTKVISKA
jgi:DNA polymerase III subunit delta'